MANRILRTALLAAALIGPSAALPAQAPNDALLGPMASDLRNRVGRWCVEAQLQLTPEARPVTIAAVAEHRLIGDRWLVTEMRGPGFQGVGLNGYDPEARHYTGYWADGSRGFAIPVAGDYDADARVFRTVSTERRADGERVTVHSETRAAGPDEEVTIFIAPDARGRPYQRMLLRYRRAQAVADCGAADRPMN